MSASFDSAGAKPGLQPSDQTTSGTAEQLKADADHLAARRALDTFRQAHETYFAAVGRPHPITGQVLVTPNPALDRESHRLFEAYVATNVAGHAADALAHTPAANRTAAKRRKHRP